jgi:hypothetical protein
VHVRVPSWSQLWPELRRGLLAGFHSARSIAG